MKTLPEIVDLVSEYVALRTRSFVASKVGELFLGLVLIGPVTFLPTVWQAWTAANIDAFRTPTWLAMTVVNCSALLGVIHKGDWRMRLVMTVWVVMMLAVHLATAFR